MLIRQRRLEELDRILPVEDPATPAKQKAAFAPPARPCRSGGRPEVQFPDARYILERASARETTARVAVGAWRSRFSLISGLEC